MLISVFYPRVCTCPTTGHKRMPVPHQTLGKGAGATHRLLGPKITVGKEGEWAPGGSLTPQSSIVRGEDRIPQPCIKSRKGLMDLLPHAGSAPYKVGLSSWGPQAVESCSVEGTLEMC